MSTNPAQMVITREIISAILAQYSLPLYGVHGLAHWARVLENGRRLSTLSGAKIQVVELFAVFHDACRQNEIIDDGHGKRGAELAACLRGDLLNLNDTDFELLFQACARHTDGQINADITLQTCWDSDRLDLARVCIQPDPRYLCTPAARNPQIIDWAVRRSQAPGTPDLIYTEWGLPQPTRFRGG